MTAASRYRDEYAAMRELRVRLRESQERESELIAAMVRAIDALDSMNLESYTRETYAAAVLEHAIGRNPRVKLPQKE